MTWRPRFQSFSISPTLRFTFKQLYRIHQAGGYFVVRAKKNLQFETVSWKRRLPKNVCSDSMIRLTVYKSSLPGVVTTCGLLGWRAKAGVCFYQQRYPHIVSSSCRSLQKPMASGSVLQMVQAASQNQEILGYDRKRRSHSDILRHHRILSCCHRSEGHETWTEHLRSFTDFGNIPDRQNSFARSSR